ncbi:Uncharacterised protein [Mycobacteroides abscessus]|nr:Uncharacterised protein [Mycobacteroides abscessus]SIK44200.1 Uncharacterised protein [Mycobacteroides abscessus subsp. abscessus]SKU04429.1 Uncharacterised protein [Mycobacteroides abscessus subsp. abscessus]
MTVSSTSAVIDPRLSISIDLSPSSTSLAVSRATSAVMRSPAGLMAAWGTRTICVTPVVVERNSTT